MRDHVVRLEATLWARLPAALHHTGEPTPWTRMTRPGLHLHSFLEGPCFDAEGALWLADVPHGRLFKIAADGGGWETALVYAGEPHAVRWLQAGSLLIADHRLGLLRWNPPDEPEILYAGDRHGPFLGLSDLVVSDQGDIWFTDAGRTSLSDPRGRVFHRKPDGSLRQVLSNMPYPNGIALSPDGRDVYVAVTRANAVWRFAAGEDGPAAPMTGVFVQLSGGLGPDGLAVDGLGRLAVAQARAGRAYVFDPLGDMIADIRLPEGSWTTAVAFHPTEPGQLFIVEAQTGSVYRVDLGTAGDIRSS